MTNRLTDATPLMLGVLRIMSGLLFLAHGTQKFLGFPQASTPAPAWRSTTPELLPG